MTLRYSQPGWRTHNQCEWIRRCYIRISILQQARLGLEMPYHPTFPRQRTTSVVLPPAGILVSDGFSHVSAGRLIWSQSSSYACSGDSSPSAMTACASRAVESSNDNLIKSTGVDDEFSSTRRIAELVHH